MNIKTVGGLFVPGYDLLYERCFNVEQWTNLLMYQKDRITTALTHTSRRQYAIDIGANIGIFAINFARNGFEQIFAYEPEPLNFECLRRNCIAERNKNICCYNFAIGDTEKEIAMADHPNSGNRWIDVNGKGIKQVTLDSQNLPGCDLLKIDVEGYEAFVVRGAIETIKKFRPVIILEEESRLFGEKSPTTTHPNYTHLYEARRILEDLDYEIVAKFTHDFILVPV